MGQIPEDVEKTKDKMPFGSSVKSRKARNFFKEYLMDYTSNSNLHGLKYIGEPERTFLEK